MTILALDLGTKTGWATLRDGAVESGTWVLAKPAQIKQQKLDNLHRCCDLRFSRLVSFIESKKPFDVCYYEHVDFASTTLQGHLWGGFHAIVTMLHPAVRVVAVPVGTLKKVATGSGNADKDQMKAALARTVNAERLAKMDDNEVDAYHLLMMARIDNNV